MKQHSSEIIRLPNDATPHPSSNIEWWYCFSFLNGEKGSRYAVMVSFFRVGELQHAKGHYLIYSFIDLNRKTYKSRSCIDKNISLHMISFYLPLYLLLHPTDKKVWKLYKDLLKGHLPFPHSWIHNISMEQNPTKLIYGDTSLTFLDKNHEKFQLHVAEEDLLLDLQFNPTKPLATITHETPGNLQYYSFTRNRVLGRVKRNEEVENVTGDGWFDHQWGKGYSLLKGNGWNWFGLQLDDQRELLINQNLSLNGNISSAANLIKKDGTLHSSKNIVIQPLQYWKSLQTNAKYPIRWEIIIPELSLKLQVAALFNKQEIPIIGPIQAIWEGACIVTGEEVLPSGRIKKIEGKGFMELVGYVNC